MDYALILLQNNTDNSSVSMVWENKKIMISATF
jgi:hypothetical protein